MYSIIKRKVINCHIIARTLIFQRELISYPRTLKIYSALISRDRIDISGLRSCNMCSRGKYVTSFWKISRRIPRTESIIHTELSCVGGNLLPSRDAVRIPWIQVEGAIGVARSQYLFLETFLATRIFFWPRCFHVRLC